jgi:hypothetical protein
MRRRGFGIVALAAAMLLLHGGAVDGQDATPKKHKSKPSENAGALLGALAGHASNSTLTGAAIGAVGGAAIGSAVNGLPDAVRDASSKPDQKLSDELVKILDETQSTETFFVTLECIVHTKTDPAVAVPVIIRNADRLRLTKGLFDHSDKTAGQEILAVALKHFILVSEGRLKIVKKKSHLPDPPAGVLPTRVPVSGLTPPSGHNPEPPPHPEHPL